jgi:hypothetical protein
MIKLIPLCLIALCGCSTTNITKLAQAMSKDNAHVHIEVRSVYGVITFDREMPVNSGTNVTKTETTILRQ